MNSARKHALGAAVASALLAMAIPTRATTLTWDGGGADSGWSTFANWNPDQQPVDGDWLIFAGALRTSPVNNLSGLVLDRLTFQAGAASFTLGGQAFTMLANTPGIGGYIHNHSSNLQTINNALTLNGSGCVNCLTTGSGAGLTFNGAITLLNTGLTAGGDHTLTFNGVISGGGTTIGLDALAPLVLLNASNTYTGQTRAFTGSTLRIGASERIPDGSVVNMQGGTLNLNGFTETVAGIENSGSITIGGSGNLRIAGSTSHSTSAVISGTGGLVKLGTGSQTLGGSGTNTYSGGTTVLEGTLAVSQFATNALPDAGAILVQGGILSIPVVTETVGAVTLNGGQITGTGGLSSATNYDLRSGTVSARLAGSGGVDKSTTGTVVLSGASTYTGATNISAGTLQLGASNTLPNGTNVTITGGAVLDLGSFSDTVAAVSLVNGSITGTGTFTTTGVTAESGSISAILAGTAGLTKNGVGTLTLTGANTYTGATVINAGVLQLGASNRIADGSALTVNSGGVFGMNGFNETVGQLSGAGSVALGSGTLTYGGNGSATFSGTMSGSGGLVKQGSGTLTLSGANTYTGTTEVTAGTLTLGANNVLSPASSVRVTSGTFNVGGTTNGVGQVTLVSGTLAGLSTGLLQSGVGFALESGTVSARLGGTASLVKNTSGTVTLGAANLYGGTTDVNAGTLRLITANALPANTQVTVAAGATLDMSGIQTSAGSLAGGGTVALGTGGLLSVGGNNQSTTFSGTLTGAATTAGIGALTKTGTGTLTLNGPILYSGNFTVAGGTLDLPNGLTQAGRRLQVSNGGAVTAAGLINRQVIGQAGGRVTASGDLILGDLSGGTSSSFAGSLEIGGNVVQLVNLGGQASISGSATLAGGGQLTVLDQENGILLAPGGSVSASGSAAVNGDFVNRGAVHGPSASGQALTFNDDVSGDGSFSGNVVFTDSLSIGLSPALVSMENVTFDGTDVLMELGGILAGTQHDKLDVSGLLRLQGGLLSVSLVNGFVPQAGNVFDLFDWGSLEGTFDQIALPDLENGLFWSTANLYVDGTIAAVPEPETYALLLAGLGLLGFAARRRRRNQEEGGSR